jgi:hypothetical protein
MKKILIIIICLLAFIFGSIYGYENPENMDLIKSKVKKNFSPKIKKETGPLQKVKC